MSENFEKRDFKNNEKVWLRSYRELSNIWHWHMESELIHITEGTAQIKIGDSVFDGKKGDAFFCADEEHHQILGDKGSYIDIYIFDTSVTKGITEKFSLTSPKLTEGTYPLNLMKKVGLLLSEKDDFYTEMLEVTARELILCIFKGNPYSAKTKRALKELISKINNEYGDITFLDAVKYSGYTPSHFSKMFKNFVGMTFSEYLNLVRVENAVMLLQGEEGFPITEISHKCGFSTIRNFNRAFKEITGYSPKNLPSGFRLNENLKILRNIRFDSTKSGDIIL